MFPSLASRVLALLLTLAAGAHGQTAPLAPTAPPHRLAGTHGKFDFLAIDETRRRLLAAHTGNNSLDVIDLDKGEVLASVPTGAAQDCALDPAHGRYFVSASRPPQLVTVDAETLSVTGKIPLPGPADLLAFHSPSGQALVCHDDASELWLVHPEQQKVIGSIALPSDSPEDLCFDAGGSRLFQAMKTGAVIAVIDLSQSKVVSVWPLAPVKSPHGMVSVPDANALVVAGGNALIAMVSQEDGRILSTAPIPEKVDQIAYDPALHRLYAASALGRVAVLEVHATQLTSLGEVPTSPGARSVAVDPQTHRVWIAWGSGDESYVQSFSAQQ